MIALLRQLLIAHLKQLVQRNQFALLEQIKMIILGQSEFDFLGLINLERRIVLGKSLIEPWWNFRLSEVRVYHRVNIFMEYCAERVLVIALGRDGDPVHVRTRLKISSDE